MNAEQYKTVADAFRTAMPGQAVWEVEAYWQGDR